MLQNWVKGIVRHQRLRKIAAMVREGKVPAGVSRDTIFEALKMTRPKNAFEAFGILSMKHYGPDGQLKADLGVQSVKKITLAFVKFLADGFCASGSAALLDDFVFHAAGAGSAAEASGDIALGAETGARVTGSQTHGASSNIYETVKTWVASGVFTAIEHGIFNQLTASASQILLDRSLVTSPPTCATGDEIVFTYDLTLNTET